MDGRRFTASIHNIADSDGKIHVTSPKNHFCKTLYDTLCIPASIYTPVVALLAELLLEVAQGETVALHGPPVGDLLATEEVRHHRLATARPVASYGLFTLLHPESRQGGRR